MKVGILGCAHIHIHSYVSCLKELKVEITAVHDYLPARAEKFGQQYGISIATSIENFFEMDFDTVLICSENRYHLKDTEAAAEEKKHIIVEKPMAMTVEEADKMIEVTKKNNVKLLVCHPVRFSKTMKELKGNIEAGNLGDIYGINASNHGKNPGGWFVEKELSGGGALVDHTIHISDLIYWMFGFKVDFMTAYTATAIADISVEDTGLIHGVFDNGSVFSIDTSWNRPDNYPVWGDAILEIISSKGRTIVDGFGRRAITYSLDASVGQWDFYEENMDMAMMKEFVYAIENDLPSPVDGLAGRYTVEMFNKAYDAVRKNGIE